MANGKSSTQKSSQRGRWAVLCYITDFSCNFIHDGQSSAAYPYLQSKTGLKEKQALKLIRFLKRLHREVFNYKAKSYRRILCDGEGENLLNYVGYIEDTWAIVDTHRKNYLILTAVNMDKAPKAAKKILRGIPPTN